MPNNVYTERESKKISISLEMGYSFFIPVCHVVLRIFKREEVRQGLPAASLNLNNYFFFKYLSKCPKTSGLFSEIYLGKILMRSVSVGRLLCCDGNQFLTGSL